MHPALSIIFFTSFSGLGYGLLFWLGIAAESGLLPADRGFAVTALLLAFASVTVGLLSSTLHLGHPERAWRAFSQWRTSWLSREGVASVITYLPALAFGWGWVVLGTSSGFWADLGALAAVCAAATVACTAYIYASLKPIPRWHNGWVPANYLALAGMTGGLWLGALAALFGHDASPAIRLGLALILIAAALKLLYWRHIDTAAPVSTTESATGLGHLGKVRLFEAPHTSENYLLKEMGYRVARKHAAKLRRIAALTGFVLPFLLLLLALASSGWLRVLALPLAALFATFGVLVERWLFFAEAKHAVTLYYGTAEV